MCRERCPLTQAVGRRSTSRSSAPTWSSTRSSSRAATATTSTRTPRSFLLRSPPPQRYISPFVGSGNVPRISHWFICYHETTPIPVGSLQVLKQVQAPDGVPVTPLPTSFTALVNCIGDPAHQNVTISFGLGGGRSSTPDLVGIPIGTVCTVVEQSPGSGRGGQLHPSWCQLAGSDHQLWRWRGRLHHQRLLERPVCNVAPSTSRRSSYLAPPAWNTPPTFTVEIACDDGTASS